MAPLAGLPHHKATAKRVVVLWQGGAPSHVDLFDYKPKLREWQGREIPAEIQGGKRLSTMTSGQKAKPCLGEISEFARHGQCGAWVSDAMPQALGEDCNSRVGRESAEDPPHRLDGHVLREQCGDHAARRARLPVGPGAR